MHPLQWLITARRAGLLVRVERPDSESAWRALRRLHALGWSVSMRRLGAHAVQVAL